ncbi:asparagine synthase-related protein [Actinomadura macra]|uniref:asparagine synthase-related protein n=1 Tax=Actinomadura macra TaxID=46164 RepID=UPI001470B679|nr:asparagine synthase-related protein [Actinomadura macra]
MEILALPDHAAAEGVAGGLARPQTIPHASGRPWIVGRWLPGEVTWAADRRCRVAVLGCATIDSERLTAALPRIRTVDDVSRLAGSLSGSFHVLAAVNGVVRAQGSLSTACQIFHARVGEVTVAANAPDLLADLTGAPFAEETLALHLLAPAPPYPLNERSLWRGVKALPFGCYLELALDGAGRAVRWWAPPTPETPLAEGAEHVRSALADAVAARVRPGGTVSADLSGGLDSTSLCFLMAAAAAAPDAPRLMTIHRESLNQGNDDLSWARQAARAMAGVHHVVLPGQQVPGMFAGLGEPDSDAESPLTRVHVRAKIRHTAAVLAEHGSTLHVTGDGGDELFYAGPSFLHTLARRHPVRWLRNMRVDRSLHRWRLTATVREVLNGRSYGEWLSACAATLTDPLPRPSRSPEIGWDATIRMPAWATPAAVDAVRALIDAAEDVQPMSPLRCEHTALRGLRKGGEVIRRTGRITGRYGISWQAPFLDDRVIEAALSLRLEDRAATGAYKPALAAVMRGTVPDAILARRTKAEFSQGVYTGLRENLPELLALCDDMRLARLGLVDADAFRAALVGLYPNSRGLLFLHRTLACEVWLRSVPASAAPAAASPTGGTA